jgi:inner membrane protein
VDNITHTLAGLVVAEVALSLRREREPRVSLARAAWLASAFANNTPDLDLAYTSLLERPFGYLLHHRGHTHTFVLAPLLSLVPFAAAVALERWSAKRESEPPPTRSSWPLLFGLSLLGCITHVAMDATNNFGVHPLWPFDGRWFFGDTIFIVEPIWWVVLAAPLAWSARSKVARGLLAVPPLLAVALSVGTGMVLPSIAGALGVLALAVGLASRSLSRVRRGQLALAAGAATFALFAVSGREARARATSELRLASPDATLHDLVLSPMPGNPLCWTGLGVETYGTSLRYQRLAVAPWPSLLDARSCNTIAPTEVMAARTTIVSDGAPTLRPIDELRVPLERFRQLARDDCRVAAYLVFSRAPFAVDRPDGLLLGDARYDNSSDPSWSKVVLAGPAATCPGPIPGWVPPRADVLGR